jgi:Protein of unknown function (DUF1403)
VWRRRLALKAAAASARIARRGEDEATLRDAFLLRQGDDPGPAGRMLVAWRGPDEQYPIIEACSPGPLVELFARGVRPNWATWGNEAHQSYEPKWATYAHNSANERLLAAE